MTGARTGPGRRPGRPLRTIFAAPVALAALTVFGLLSALLGQGGIWYWLSWLTLGVPIAVAAWFALRPS